MTNPKMILQVVFVFCLLSSAFSFPYIPDAEDDIHENEINAGKFEDIDEEIAHDEEILEVHPEKDDDDDDEEEKVLDAEEKDIIEEEHEIAKDEEKLDEEEKAIIEEKHEIAKDEEGLDAEEKVIIEEDKKIAEDEDEEKIPDPFKKDDDDEDESGEHFGGFDEEEVHKPHFFAHMYHRAREFLKGLGK